MSNVSVLNTDVGLAAKSVDILESDQTISGLKTFSRGAAVPFAVAAGSLNVPNLDADKLDGQDWAAPTITGAPTFSGSINLTGGQITFPAVQNASAGANTLDDYEEQTWAPAPTGFTGAVTVNNAKYTKIGNLVVCWLDYFGTSNTNAMTFVLPFASAIALSTLSGACRDNSVSQNSAPRLDFGAASTTVTIYRLFDGTAWTNVNTKGFHGMFFFFV